MELFWSAFSCIRTEYGVSLRIQPECGKMRNRITPNTDTFYAVSGIHIVIIYEKMSRMDEEEAVFKS